MGALQIRGPHGSRQPIAGVVRQLHRLLFGIERRHVADGTEDLLLDAARSFREAAHDGRLDEGAAIALITKGRHAAATDDFAVLLARQAVVGQNFLAVRARDQRSQVRALVRPADLERARPCAERLHEALEDRALYVDALGAQAHLPAVGEHRAHGAAHGRLEVRVCKHHGGVLAAELERQRLHRVRGASHDGRPGRRLTGEGNGIHIGVTDQRLAGGAGPETMHQVENPGRHAGLLHHLREQRRRGGGLLGGLGDHGIAARQRRGDLPGHEQERQVPRRDDRHHADGLVHRVVERAAAIGRAHLEALRAARQREIRIGAEVGSSPRDVERARLLQRLAGVGDFGAHELGEALLDALRHLAQQRAALGHRQARPRPAQRGARGLHRALDERIVRLGDRADGGAVDGIDVLERASLAHELAPDEAGELAAGEGVRVDFAGHPGCVVRTESLCGFARCAGDCRSGRHPRNNRILPFRYADFLYQNPQPRCRRPQLTGRHAPWRRGAHRVPLRLSSSTP